MTLNEAIEFAKEATCIVTGNASAVLLTMQVLVDEVEKLTAFYSAIMDERTELINKLVELDVERDALMRRVAELNSICGRFSNVAYNVHQFDRPLKEHEKQSLKDLQVEYDALQRANQIEGVGNG